MKRFHIHVGVENIETSVKFYSALFGVPPAKLKPDYAKWMLEDPRLNFAISTRAGIKGIDHLGLQVDEENELADLRERLAAADMTVVEEGTGICCYARSDKTWVEDPSGIPWEAYRTMEDAQIFSNAAPAVDDAATTACCAPPARPAPVKISMPAKGDKA